jgi:hypothetical protein
MINIGIKRLLPNNWKAVAWIDADIEFENNNWALNALKILNGHKDIIQLFSHCIDMGKDGNTMHIFSSLGFQYSKNNIYIPFVKGNDFWHPGYAWACTRKAYETMGGLYELSILGSGDTNIALSILNNGDKSYNENITQNYKKSIMKFQKRSNKLRIGYIPGVIKHFYHGSKKNRQYLERWQILVDNKYHPGEHITKNKDGILIPTESFPNKLKSDILNYFKERNEDE